MNAKIAELLGNAWSLRREGNYDEAMKIVRRAHDSCPENDYDALGRIYHVYMQFKRDHDHLEEAVLLSRQSVSYYRLSKNMNRIAHSVRHLADLEFELGNLKESEVHYKKAIQLYLDNSNTSKGDLANALRQYALLLEKTGKNVESANTWTTVRDLYTAIHLKEGVSEAEEHLDRLNQLL